MRKKLTTGLRYILDIIKQHDNGVKSTDILMSLNDDISDRTLLRRLHDLQDMKLIRRVGDKSAARYFIINDNEIILSTTSKALKEQIARPVLQRTPVPYHREFLYDYQPNKTFYLSESTRKHLKKIGQIFEQPLEPATYANRILDRLLIDLSWNSSRLEGNTYSLLDTERLIEFGVDAEGKNNFESQMILNHKNAIEFMVSQAGGLKFDTMIIQNIHALLSENLLSNPKASGQLRQIPVGIGNSVYHPPEIPHLIEECFEHIIKTAAEIIDPFEQAFFIMVQLPYLQPFEDVNKRVSRLGANIPLIRENYSPLSFIDVPQGDYIAGLLAIYELNQVDLMRDVFVWAYERSTKQYQLVQETLGQPNLLYMQYRSELHKLIRYIINNNLQGKMILAEIESWAKKQTNDNCESLVRLAEREIHGLHEGNLAIYRIATDAFQIWKYSP